MKTRAGAICLMGSLALALGACASVDDDYDLEFRTSTIISGGDGGSSGGGDSSSDDGGTLVGGGGKGGSTDPGGGGDWGLNGLEEPLVGGVSVAHPLNTSQGMSETGSVLSDPSESGPAAYLIRCALADDQSITKTVNGQEYTYQGEYGLAEEWETGSCDGDCQEWVTACLLAHMNTSGQTVAFWMQAEHPAIGYGMPQGENLVREASWGGNLFLAPDDQFLCKGAPTGNPAAVRAGRTCSVGGGQNCDLTKYNDCTSGDRCAMAGPNADVPMDCQAGTEPAGAAYHIISTYLPW